MTTVYNVIFQRHVALYRSDLAVFALSATLQLDGAETPNSDLYNATGHWNIISCDIIFFADENKVNIIPIS